MYVKILRAAGENFTLVPLEYSGAAPAPCRWNRAEVGTNRRGRCLFDFSLTQLTPDVFSPGAECRLRGDGRLPPDACQRREISANYRFSWKQEQHDPPDWQSLTRYEA